MKVDFPRVYQNHRSSLVSLFKKMRVDMDEQFNSNQKTFVVGLKMVVTDDKVEVVICHLTSIEIWENY